MTILTMSRMVRRETRIGASTNWSRFSGSRRISFRTIWRSSEPRGSLAHVAVPLMVETCITGPIFFAAGTSLPKSACHCTLPFRSASKSPPTLRLIDLANACCFYAPATVPAHRLLKHSWPTAAQARLKRAALGVTQNRCTHTRFGSWLNTASTSPGT